MPIITVRDLYNIYLLTYVKSSFRTEGPMSHDQPTYASVPGIRVYGMMCVTKNGGGGGHQSTLAPPLHSSPAPITKRRARPLRTPRSLDAYYRRSSESKSNTRPEFGRELRYITIHTAVIHKLH